MKSSFFRENQREMAEASVAKYPPNGQEPADLHPYIRLWFKQIHDLRETIADESMDPDLNTDLDADYDDDPSPHPARSTTLGGEGKA